MMMNPLPDIDKAFPLVIQQERELDNFASVVAPAASNFEESVAFQVHTNSGNYNNKSNTFKGKNQSNNGARGHSRICTHCGKQTTQLKLSLLNMVFHQDSETKANSRAMAMANKEVLQLIMHQKLLSKIHL
ncbi:unnamed protein product [Vicia faba]|uniref:Uncharacterized protein n=1 Tax=Vicia faba TaxID=3906 RepID=A0AAV1AFD9_VICFA|nr:unnamed protein product [Vicia faba]